MAYVYSAGPSLHATSSLAPRALFVPRAMTYVGPDKLGDTASATDHGGALALVARAWRQDCQPACGRLAAPTELATKSERTLAETFHDKALPDSNALAVRFDTVAASAALSPQKLASLFARSQAEEAGTQEQEATAAHFAAAAETASIELAEPSADRFASASVDLGTPYIMALAVGEVDESADNPLMASIEPEAETLADQFALPSPEIVPLPSRRPAVAKKVAPAVAEKPTAVAVAADTPKPKNRRNQATPLSQRAESVALAYAAPDDGAGGVGKAFNNLFNSGPSAVGGKKVAVYNISARTVTMPDGEVLAAFSGIGEMANNPKYVAVKMRGPTPPDTYKLRMRESRFHGVEAIRMLPVDGKTKHGRTGFLAHTELLRGRKGQSHGCVAFKDYDRFLNAFKKGKVTHMVVIAGNGRAGGTKVASNDRKS